MNPLNFTMAFGGANPLAQIINIAMTDNSAIRYSVSAANAKGGNWLSISPSGVGCCFTPLANVVSVNAGSLAAEPIPRRSSSPNSPILVGRWSCRLH